MLSATLDGDPTAIRATFERIEALCAGFDSEVPNAVLTPVIQDWSDELELLRR